MKDARILWVDDEIEHLKSHILFLEQKEMSIDTVSNGEDAINAVVAKRYDIVFLDENMPGMNGLETLAKIKELQPHIPIVMITKSEEEHLMEDAIGAKITDYLIKPVNPNQILLSCKKILEGRELVSHHANKEYQQDFREITMAFMDELNADDWIQIHKKLSKWEIELENSTDNSMQDILYSQRAEANVNFGKYIVNNYESWVNANSDERPILSPDVLDATVLPRLKNKEKVCFILIDCMRYDQWKVLETLLAPYFHIASESAHYSILPTATQYARNAMFSGMFPLEITKKYPKYWVADDEDGGKNLHEADFLQEWIVRKRLDIKHDYTKVTNATTARKLNDQIANIQNNDLSVIIINFIDMLVHARSEMDMVKQLAPDEAALRSLSLSWLSHSPVMDALVKLSKIDCKLIITADHGSVRVKKPIKVIGDRDTSTNLRYKHGRNLSYDVKKRQIYAVHQPEDIQLPSSTASGSFIFSLEDTFFIYPKNYNHFVNHYTNTFQHGGVSMEEMIVPLIELEPKHL